jgi:hypothetical protein
MKIGSLRSQAIRRNSRPLQLNHRSSSQPDLFGSRLSDRKVAHKGGSKRRGLGGLKCSVGCLPGKPRTGLVAAGTQRPRDKLTRRKEPNDLA